VGKIELGQSTVELPFLEEDKEIMRLALSHDEIRQEHQYTIKVINWLSDHESEAEFTERLLLNLAYQARALSPFINPGDEDFPLTLEAALNNKRSNCLLLPMVIACRLLYAAEAGALTKGRYQSILTVIALPSSQFRQSLAHGVLLVYDNQDKEFYSIHSTTALSGVLLCHIWNNEITGRATLKTTTPVVTFNLIDEFHPEGTTAHLVLPYVALTFNQAAHLLEIGDVGAGKRLIAEMSAQLPKNHPLISHASVLMDQR